MNLKVKTFETYHTLFEAVSLYIWNMWECGDKQAIDMHSLAELPSMESVLFANPCA